MPTGFYELQYIDKLEKTIEKLKKEIINKKAINLLQRAEDKLQDYRGEIDGDYNDGLAMEIRKYLNKLLKKGVKNE